jgi:hypothetical protein
MGVAGGNKRAEKQFINQNVNAFQSEDSAFE